MTDIKTSIPDTSTTEASVACAVCLKEIPKSEAGSAEGTDYLLHFCGLDCYDLWQQDHDNPAQAHDTPQ
jgi:hypothetical protein